MKNPRLHGLFSRHCLRADSNFPFLQKKTKYFLGIDLKQMRMLCSSHKGRMNKVEVVLLRGRIVIEGGECNVEKGRGQFIKREGVKI